MTASAERDVRQGGQWTLSQRVKNDLLWLIASAALGAFGRLPSKPLRAFGAALGAFAHAVLPASRRLAENNVALAFPELDARDRQRLVRRAFRTLGTYLGETVGLLDPRRTATLLPFATDAQSTLDAALAERRGVLFASAHLGPWEHVARTIVAHGYPFTTIAREAYDPRLTSLYDRLRGARGVDVVYRGAPGAATRLLRTLRRGAILGIPMDLASRVPSVEVPFLGRAARTAVGPARLALRTGAAVVVGVPAPRAESASSSAATSKEAPRSTARELDLELVITRITSADLDASDDGARILTTRINECISARIRALPEAWVWMHPRWSAS